MTDSLALATGLPTPSAATQAEQLRTLFRDHLADPRSSWSVGTFGAIAEFHRDAEEHAELSLGEEVFSAHTERGALRLVLAPRLLAYAYETPGSQPGHWNHAVALCLPKDAAVMHRRQHLTELGADAQAVRAQDRAGVLFDMGLGCQQIDVCVRTADAETLAALRAGLGSSLLDPANPLMGAMPRLSPHRVFACHFARAEVYQPVPAPGGVSPAGPHTHVLPKLMREERTYAATIPIPEGWTPCAHLYPAHPMRDAMGQTQPFDAEAHGRFQQLLMQFGDPALWRLKQRVLDALEQGAAPGMGAASLTRHERATARIAIRQWAATHAISTTLSMWTAAFDAAAADAMAGAEE